MLPRDRLWISAVLALGFAGCVLVGGLIGSGELIFPLLATAILACLGLRALTVKTVRVEVMILSFLLFGYIVGNRGFAGIKLAPGLPLYFGEVGLVLSAAFWAMRNAFLKQNPIPPDALSYTILLFLILGSVRFLIDFRTYGTMAARDFAAVYYSAFFFLGYSASQHLPSRRFFENALLLAIVVLIPIHLVDLHNREILAGLTLQGAPVIWHKGDLIAAFLAWGSFYSFIRGSASKHPLPFIVISLVAGVLMIHSSSRAAYVAAASVCVLFVIAGKYKWIVMQGIAGAVALGILLSVSTFRYRDVGVYEAIKLSQGATDSHSQNNHFRLIWWKAVIDETWETSPVLGLGFGHDLSARFLRTYDLPIDTREFDVRSPHSYFVTIFGRMGCAGETLLVLIAVFILKNAVEAAWNVRRGKLEFADLAPWTGVVMLLGTAAFGVVLEGPMGAVPFWLVLGMAMERKSRLYREPSGALPAPRRRATKPPYPELSLA